MYYSLNFVFNLVFHIKVFPDEDLVKLLLH